MGHYSPSPARALARLSELIHRPTGPVDVGATLKELAACAQDAVGATGAAVEWYDGAVPVPQDAEVLPRRMRIPVRTGETSVAAALVLDGVQIDEQGPVEHEVLELCAALVSATLRSAQRREARAREDALEHAVHAVVTASVQHLELDDMLIDAVEALRLGVRCQGVWIRAFDVPDAPASRRHAASFPVWADALATDDLLDVSGRAARICWDRQTVSSMHVDHPDIEALTTDAERDYMFDFMRSVEVRSMLMAPLGGGGQCQGFIALTRSTVEEPFDALDEAAVMSIGREVGNAVVHARLFDRQRALVGELQELHGYKDRFVATVAHQLKSPLTSIVGHTELLEDTMAVDGTLVAARATDSLSIIARCATRIHDTIDSLLTLSAVQDVERPLSSTAVSLAEVVTDCCGVLAMSARENGIALDRSGVAPGVTAYGDRKELEKVVDNIVGNAVKYSRPGGTVILTASRVDGQVLLECRDAGLGISEEELPRLFEPFHRSDDPRAQAISGTGLGLAIVKAVVDRHQGRIEIESVPDVGTTFRVWLPAAG